MIEQFEKELKALADKTRLLVLQRISQGQQCGCELIQNLDISQPTLSHHLKQLSDVGLIEGIKEKNKILYSVNTKKIESIFANIALFLHEKPSC